MHRPRSNVRVVFVQGDAALVAKPHSQRKRPNRRRHRVCQAFGLRVAQTRRPMRKRPPRGGGDLRRGIGPVNAQGSIHAALAKDVLDAAHAWIDGSQRKTWLSLDPNPFAGIDDPSGAGPTDGEAARDRKGFVAIVD